MSQFSFESKLTPEQIQARLYVLAKPAHSIGWRIVAPGSSPFFYRFYNRTHFFLIKTRSGQSGGASINQPVFLGKFTEKEGMTLIEGRFGWERRQFILFLLVCLIAITFVCKDIWYLLLFALLAALGSVYSLAIVSSLYSEQEKAVIELIKKYLLL